MSFTRDSNLNFNLGNNKFNFLIDNQLIDILVDQDFDKLIEYKLESLITIYENKIVSISDDGSMISIDRNLANL